VVDQVKNTSEAFGIFPIPMYQAKVKSLNFFKVDEAVKATGGWQENDGKNFISKDKYILNHPHLDVLKAELQTHLKTFLEDTMRLTTRFNITQSWVNRNPKGTFHREHQHRNSIWNCVLFLKDHPTPMTFRDPNPWKDLWDFESQTLSSNWANGNVMKFYPEFGNLLIFPHYLHHSVEENVYEGDRYSLAFNTWFADDFGSEARLTATGVKDE
jgi:uncharacterized protein (TIGR02466 family)